MSGDIPTLAVWRHRWLAPSETFIRDQVAALRSWHALKVGLYELEPSLVRPDVAPFASSGPSRLRRYLASPARDGAIWRPLKEADVRLVHAHFATEGRSAVSLSEALHVPLVVTCHGYDVTSEPAGARQRARQRRSIASAFSHASRLIAVSDFVADRMEHLGAPRDKIMVHKIGIPTDVALAHGDEPGPRSGVLFAGRFVKKKGVLDLLRAYAALPRGLRDTHPLSLAGDGDERPRIERLAAELGIQVRFLGWQEPTSLRHLMRRAAVFCGPSRTAPDGDSEGFGLVFLEAALCGTPAVSYRHGGVPEAVEDGRTGLLAEEGNLSALTEALEAVLGDSRLARALGQHGRLRVLAEFDIAKTTSGLEAIYDDVVGISR